MKPKLILCLTLALGGELIGCNSRHIPSAPSADQVREWAGFPANFQLQTASRFMTNGINGSQSKIGKPIWDCRYENTKCSRASFEIVVCEHGTLWGTNRTQITKQVEKQVAMIGALKNSDTNYFQIVTFPGCQKAYFTVFGFGPGGTGLVGFSYEPDYDLIVSEDIDAETQIQNPISPTNDLPVIFGKVQAFLDAH